MTAEVVSLSARRRKKQEQRVHTSLKLTEAERAHAQHLLSPAELDQFIINDELFDIRKLDTDTFPIHPWTGE